MSIVDAKTLAVVDDADLELPMSSVPAFDYSVLDEATKAFVEAKRDAIRKHSHHLADRMLQIGLALIAVKDSLPHGQFLPWVRAEFRWSERTARYFIRVAEEFGGKSAIVANFEPAALRELVARDTPAKIRERFISEAEAGKRVLTKDVREALPPKPRKPRLSGETPAAPGQASFDRLLRVVADLRNYAFDYAMDDLADTVVLAVHDRLPEAERLTLANLLDVWGPALSKAANVLRERSARDDQVAGPIGESNGSDHQEEIVISSTAEEGAFA